MVHPQHTAGPWRVGDTGHTVFGPPNGNPSPETIALVRSRANARLIATAPEMLAELKDIARSIDRDSGYPRFTAQQYDRLLALIHRATQGGA